MIVGEIVMASLPFHGTQRVKACTRCSQVICAGMSAVSFVGVTIMLNGEMLCFIVSQVAACNALLAFYLVDIHPAGCSAAYHLFGIMIVKSLQGLFLPHRRWQPATRCWRSTWWTSATLLRGWRCRRAMSSCHCRR